MDENKDVVPGQEATPAPETPSETPEAETPAEAPAEAPVPEEPQAA